MVRVFVFSTWAPLAGVSWITPAVMLSDDAVVKLLGRISVALPLLVMAKPPVMAAVDKPPLPLVMFEPLDRFNVKAPTDVMALTEWVTPAPALWRSMITLTVAPASTTLIGVRK